MPNASIPLLEFWYAGLRAKFGVRLRTANGVGRLRAAMYKARKDSGDPDLQALALCPSRIDPTNELWVVHKTVTITIPDEELDDAP